MVSIMRQSISWTHFEADSSISVCIEHAEHFVDEDLGLVPGHEVHGHDALLVQGAARAHLDKSSEKTNFEHFYWPFVKI